MSPAVDHLIAGLTVVVVEGIDGVAEKRGGDVVVEASDGSGKTRLYARREEMTNDEWAERQTVTFWERQAPVLWYGVKRCDTVSVSGRKTCVGLRFKR